MSNIKKYATTGFCRKFCRKLYNWNFLFFQLCNVAHLWAFFLKKKTQQSTLFKCQEILTFNFCQSVSLVPLVSWITGHCRYLERQSQVPLNFLDIHGAHRVWRGFWGAGRPAAASRPAGDSVQPWPRRSSAAAPSTPPPCWTCPSWHLQNRST